jgi:6-pyruvoyltetrahydropterin/6-carboxytetrahydropterin synthase
MQLILIGSEDMLTVTKKFEFEACHHLNDYDGACARLHGHTYKLEVTLAGIPDKNGIIIDFQDIKKVVHTFVIDRLDHYNLNECVDEHGEEPLFSQPTAENMVLWIVNTLLPVFINYGCILDHVRLYETSNSHADWSRDCPTIVNMGADEGELVL